jgi:phage terminase large subunit-like protein
MAKMGRPRLSRKEKLRRGTLKKCRDKKAQKGARGRAVESAESRDYVTIARQYAADVLSGKIVACQWVKLACERQDRDIMRAMTDPSWGFVWSDAHAVEACHFIEQLPHVEGQWSQPLIHLEPPQIFLVACLFGWRHRAHPARRRFTVVYWELGRKGAKSTLMAAISLFHLCCEHEPGASVICGATTGSQARIVFGIAQKMVRHPAAGWLRRLGVQALANAIITEDGSMKPVNAKASTQDGLNPSAIVLDESHAQKFGLYDVLKSAQGARLNPLMLCPTTAGYDLLSVGYALRTTLTKVLQQVFEADHFLGLIYTLDEGDDWRDLRLLVKANPMLGVTPTVEWVKNYCADAQQTPGLEGEFRVKVCSQWMQAASAWLSMTRWDACADPSLTIEQFAGQRCWIGADLAQNDDIAAVACCFEQGADVVAFVRFYLPREVVDERARTVPAYRSWVSAGLLHLTDGNMIDYGKIEADIRGWCKQFNVVALRFDQYGSAGIVSSLAGDGFPAAILDKNRKTFTPPARALEARVHHQRFKHDGNSCLKWMASNTVVTRGVDDSILPKKESAESPNKMDGIDAILQALSAMIAPTEKPKAFQMIVVGGRG